MDRNGTSFTTAFNKLPIELNKEIAHYLEADKDVCNFRLICRTTNDAVDGDKLSFWRARFREKYAFTEGVPNRTLKKQYQRRAKYLLRGITADFSKLGHGKTEFGVMSILRELIVESYQGAIKYDDFGRPRCPNQEHIINFMFGSRHFMHAKQPSSQSPKSKEAYDTLNTIQIMCGQFLFEMNAVRYDMLPFDESQKAVYARVKDQPIFIGSNFQVNMNWTLHCLNFFLHHMMREDAHSLYNTMAAMEVGDRPSAWRGALEEGCRPLSKYWKGTYAYLEQHELDKIRKLSPNRSSRWDTFYFEDKNVEMGGKIQELELDFVEAKKLPWPQSFEKRLQSLRPTMPPRTRAQHRASKPGEQQEPKSIRLVGEGLDQDDYFFASGWINPLLPQYGIPGWQRVTLMKHFAADFVQAHNDDLWAYEGVVLPGGRLMLGRWWYASAEPDEPSYGDHSGPFILWAVDSPPVLDSDSEA